MAHSPDASSAMLPCSTWTSSSSPSLGFSPRVPLYISPTFPLILLRALQDLPFGIPLKTHLLFGNVHPGFSLTMTEVSLIIPLPGHPNLLSLQLIITPPLSVHLEQASLKLATPLTLSEKSLLPSNPRCAQNDSSLEAWGGGAFPV